MKRYPALAMLISALTTTIASAQTIFMDGISVSNDYVRHVGLIDVAGWNTSHTGEVRHLGISYGQLVGIDPSTGMSITNEQNLLPLKVHSVVAVSNITALSGIFGNGIGITNLPSNAFTETDPLFILWLGTNTYIRTEADPLWTSASNLYYLKNQVHALFATGTPVYAESDPLFAIWLGTNSYLQTEADPIWIAASNSYYLKAQANALFATGAPVYVEADPSFGAWLGTNSYVETEADPLWSGASNQYYTKTSANALFATGTPLYAFTETDPAFGTWLGTNAYVHTEADPIWIAASNSYYLKAQANALFATGTPVYTETDPAWESARSTGTTFGAEIGVSGIKMMVADIRRNTNNAVIGLLAGDAWNTGAMLQLGGDEQESGDVVYGGGQVLMKNNSSRFRIRDREGWTEIADFRGDGTTYFGGSIVPGTDNVYALGNATFPWSALYVGSSTINQSYLDGLMRADGSRAFTSNLNMGGHSITNISTNSLVYTDGKSVQQKMTEADEALTMQTVTPYWFGQFVETEAWKNNTIAEDYREVEFNLLFNGYDHSTNGIVEMKLRVYARGDSDTHMRVAIRNHTDNNYCFGHNQTTNTYTPIIWWESPWITVTNCTGPKELRVNAFTDDSSKYYFIFKTYVLVRAQKRLND